jgi:hypothetical protein
MASKYDTTNFDYLESVKIHNESLRIAEELMSKFKSFAATHTLRSRIAWWIAGYVIVTN